MAAEEKRAWIMIVVTAVAFVVYSAVILSRVDGASLTEVSYAPAMLWTIGAAIVATIVLDIAVSIAAPREDHRRDERDREINRVSDNIGQAFGVLGALGALILALVEADYFWIANAIYLAFVLSSITSSTAKIAAYRGAFQTW